MSFVKRQDKVMFLEGVEKFHRMQGFTSLSTDKNPVEYTRQYVDEAYETTDVVAISTSTDFEFDQMSDNAVHQILVDIIDEEKIGDDAVVNLLQVDLTGLAEGTLTAPATARTFAVIPGSEGGELDAYTYSGTFRVKGARVKGTATTADGWKTVTFTPTI